MTTPMLRKFFNPPQFETEDMNFRAKFINGFSWVAITLLIIGIIPYIITPADDYSIYVLSGLIVMLGVVIYLLKSGYVNLSGWVIVIAGWIGITVQAYSADGVRDVIVIAYVVISLLAGIVIDLRVSNILLVASIVAIWVLALLETYGYITPELQDIFRFSRDLTLILIAIAALVYFSATSLTSAMSRARKSEDAIVVSNEELQNLNQTLEEKIRQRTLELDAANRSNSRRARQFEAITQVSRVVSTIQDIKTLLPKVTEVISEQFGYYHVGIFLLDENRQYAVLEATNSTGGKAMLERGHKLSVGQTGIVGFVTATGQPRIALDVGADAVFFNNPNLPDTHSEIALPLRFSGQVFGALDVQSVESNAFTLEDVDVLTTLADQVSIAIQNARTFEEARKTIAEAQKAYAETAKESWKILSSQSSFMGYQIKNAEIQPVATDLMDEAMTQSIQTLQTFQKDGTIAIPIRVRDRIIGAIRLSSSKNKKWTRDDIDIIEAVTERLSLAIETASLLTAAQHRAEVERITTDISARISSSTRFESILQAAAQELSRALGGSDVLVQIEPVALEMGMKE